jgi:hypothetical protein
MKVTLQTTVLELVTQQPELRPVLIQAGLAGLADKCYWPKPEVTLEIAAQRHGVDAQALLEAVATA